jgi:CxxC motif-containing protein (DUF1111 family)
MRITARGLAIVSVLCGINSESLAQYPMASNNSADLVARGQALFTTQFTPAQGLGPLFNNTSCVGCQAVPNVAGMGPDGLVTATRVGRLTPNGFDPLVGTGGPVARFRSVSAAKAPCDLAPGIPMGANITSIRNAPDLHGDGRIDVLSDEEIVAGAIPRGDGVQGRVHWVKASDGSLRVGRFGWKADTATLKQFVADAFRNELGITSPLAPLDLLPQRHSGEQPCAGESARVEDDGSMVDALSAFVASLPAPAAVLPSPQAATLFHGTGCDACHTPSISLGERSLSLYSDLLLHDLGADLDDRVVQGSARGRDWRTTPLWGLGKRQRLLHDGRARTIAEAILAHDGEAAKAKQRFQALPQKQQGVLLSFLGQL